MSNPTYCLKGNVFAGKFHGGPGFVIRYKYNHVDSSYTPVDTVKIAYDSAKGTSNYEFSNVESGVSVLRAMLSTTSSFYKRFGATYYGDKIHWKDAKKVEVTDSCVVDLNIQLHEETSHSGKGSANGHVNNGHKKSSASAAGIEIMILDSKLNLLDMTLTDANGNFAFTNLANGAYQVYAEYTGLPTTPALINITDASSSVSNIQINIGQTAVTTGISLNTLTKSDFAVYPNPADQIIRINLEAANPGHMTGMVIDITGKILRSVKYEMHSGSNELNMDISNLKPGLYIIGFTGNNGETVRSQFVKK